MFSFCFYGKLVSTSAPMQYQDTTLLVYFLSTESSGIGEGGETSDGCLLRCAGSVDRLFQDGPQLGRGALRRAVGQVEDCRFTWCQRLLLNAVVSRQAER